MSVNKLGARVRSKLTAGCVVRALEYSFLDLCYIGVHNNTRCKFRELVKPFGTEHKAPDVSIPSVLRES